MPRHASLYFPNLAIERIRSATRPEPPSSLRPAPPPRFAPSPTPRRAGEDLECSCPATPGFRPGARWARAEAAQEIAALPPHQRPPMRELGRRSEAAPPAFRGGASGAAPAPSAWAAAGGEEEEDAPLVTAARVGGRILLAAVSPAAAAAGLALAMPLAQARILLPGLDMRPADPEGDAALLTRLGLHAARHWTPRAATCGTDGLRLDLGGVAHLFGGEAEMGRRILAFCARLGFTARIAMAGSYGAAHALARFGAAPLSICPAGGEAEALAAMPPAALRLEPAALSAARRLGIDNIGALLSMPRGPLQRRFGTGLVLRLDQALGRIAEPFDPILPEAPPAAQLRFAEPIASPEAIGEAIAAATARLTALLGARGLGLRRGELACTRVDGAVQRLRIGTARATRDGVHLLRLLRPLIERIEPGFGLEMLSLTAARCERLAPQPVAGALAGPAAAPDIVPLLDQLAGRIGARRLYRLSAVESDVPERSVAAVGPLAAARGWPAWPRPVRLLDPPEPVDKVVALLPDQPPRRFTWRGRAFRVARADGPERIRGEWWRRRAEADAVRDYFQVEAEDGSRFWLFRRGDGTDPATGDLSWYLHGLFG
jgi:protein ImuB